MHTFRLIALGAAFLLPLGAHADVKLPAIFSKHMVLQRDSAVPLWGWAAPGEEVKATIAGQTQTAIADAGGKWIVRFGKLEAKGPQTLTVSGKNTLTVEDVLIGEVWLCSGQSNMAFRVERALNPEQEKAAATFPEIRMFTVASAPLRTPQVDVKGAWVVCSPETVGSFSAVGYFFGRELHRQLRAPVGLINSSVGGTDIAAWTSEEVQQAVPALKAGFDAWAAAEAAYDEPAAKAYFENAKAAYAKRKASLAPGTPISSPPKFKRRPISDPNHPANLYNGMIAPLIPYALRGAIWYQGEHNCATAEKAALYETQLRLLIRDWRQRWGSEFPFAWVQLPNFERPGSRPVVREAMLKTLDMKNTGMAVTIDIGEAQDNHPKNKQEVGRRLSLWALATVYGQKLPSYSGPIFKESTVRGGEIVVSFEHADQGLTAKGGDLTGFAIAGPDQKWQPAKARIDGAKVVVSSPEVLKPVAVRYAFALDPKCNLYNGAGLPASPFRTDNWAAEPPPQQPPAAPSGN